MSIQHGNFIEYRNFDNQSLALGRVRSIFRDDSTGAPEDEPMSLGIEPIIHYSNLPPNLQSQSRAQRGNTEHEVWLDERREIEIKPSQVCGLAHISFAQGNNH